MWLLSMIRQLDDCVMDICCKNREVGELLPQAEAAGAKVYHIPLRATHIGYAHGLRQLLKNGRYDIVHNHLGLYSWLPVWIANDLGIPVITSFHNTRFEPRLPWLRVPPFRQLRTLYGAISIPYSLRHSTMITGCSKAVLDSVRKSGALKRGDGRVLHYGVNFPRTDRADFSGTFRREFKLRDGDRVVLHVGRFVPQKNHEAVLSVFSRVLESVPSAILFLVGDGPDRTWFEKRVRRGDLAGRVRFLGERGDVSRIMSHSDVLLFPSVYEGFGLVVLEAQAASLPVVASNVPGLAEAVTHGETGILCELGDIERMAHAVVRVLTDKNYADEIRVRGRSRIERERLSLEGAAERLLGIYRECVGQR